MTESSYVESPRGRRRRRRIQGESSQSDMAKDALSSIASITYLIDISRTFATSRPSHSLSSLLSCLVSLGQSQARPPIGEERERKEECLRRAEGNMRRNLRSSEVQLSSVPIHPTEPLPLTQDQTDPSPSLSTRTKPSAVSAPVSSRSSSCTRSTCSKSSSKSRTRGSASSIRSRPSSGKTVGGGCTGDCLLTWSGTLRVGGSTSSGATSPLAISLVHEADDVEGVGQVHPAQSLHRLRRRRLLYASTQRWGTPLSGGYSWCGFGRGDEPSVGSQDPYVHFEKGLCRRLQERPRYALCFPPPPAKG